MYNISNAPPTNRSMDLNTIADLLDGRKPFYRDFTLGGSSFKRARAEKRMGEQPSFFGEE